MALTACFDGNAEQYGDEYYGDEYYGYESYEDFEGSDGAYDAPQASNDMPNQYEARQAGGGGNNQIMDLGLGVVARTYTNLPSGWSVRGQMMTNPALGFGGDAHIEISGPNGARFIETAPVIFQGGQQGAYAGAERSIQQGLQRASVSGSRAGAWNITGQANGMQVAQAPFKSNDGREGIMQVGYQIRPNGEGMANPMVFFCQPAEGQAFMAAMKQVNAGRQNSPQWSARQQQAAQGGIATMNRAHQGRMAEAQRSFDANQRNYKAGVASNDAAHAKWMSDFRSSGSSSYSSYSGGGGGSDRAHQRELDAISGTERYHDPNIGYDQRLEAGYDRTFTNGQGEFRQSNNAFDEPSAWQGDWTEIRPVDQ